MPSKCILHIDDDDEFESIVRVGAYIDVVGVSVGSDFSGSDADALVLRCVWYRMLPITFPVTVLDRPDAEDPRHREELWKFVKNALGGDGLSAQYILAHMASTV